MKKTLFLLTILLLLSFPVRAACNLDPHRWKFLDSTKQYRLFWDTGTLETDPDHETAEAWLCRYYPGNKSSCGGYICKEKKTDTAEHYHYYRSAYDYRNFTAILKIMVVRDKDGNVTDAAAVPPYKQEETLLAVGSEGEKVVLAIKKHIKDTQKAAKKQEKKPDPEK